MFTFQLAIFNTTATRHYTTLPLTITTLHYQGFPTLVFFKGNDKAHPVKYEEGRELDDLVAFLEKNAHNSVSGSAAAAVEESDNDEL